MTNKRNDRHKENIDKATECLKNNALYGKGNDRLREEKESPEEIYAEEIESIEEQERKYNERKAEFAKHIIGDLEHFLKRPAEEWGKDEEYQLIDILSLVENSYKSYLAGNIPDYQG